MDVLILVLAQRLHTELNVRTRADGKALKLSHSSPSVPSLITGQTSSVLRIIYTGLKQRVGRAQMIEPRFQGAISCLSEAVKIPPTCAKSRRGSCPLSCETPTLPKRGRLEKSHLNSLSIFCGKAC